MSRPLRSMNPLALILGLSAAFFLIFLGVTAITQLTGSSSRKSSTSSAIFGSGSVGVIELNGVIMDSRRFLKQLKEFGEDDSIKAVVIRLNSPGGAVAPSQEIYQGVKEFKKPIISSMASVAASGAYYVAVGTQKIYANAGSIVGSIGVIMEFANLEKLYEWAKIKRFSIKTGRFKDAGAEYRPMEPEERALLQTMVDDVLAQFRKAVTDGRKLTPQAVVAVSDGRIFSGNQAKTLKLVDELGTLEDAIADAGKLGKISGKPNVVYPESPRRKFLEMLVDPSGDEDAESAHHGSGPLALLQGLLGNAPKGRSLEEQLTGLAPGIYWIWPGAR